MSVYGRPRQKHRLCGLVYLPSFANAAVEELSVNASAANVAADDRRSSLLPDIQQSSALVDKVTPPPFPSLLPHMHIHKKCLSSKGRAHPRLCTVPGFPFRYCSMACWRVPPIAAGSGAIALSRRKCTAATGLEALLKIRTRWCFVRKCQGVKSPGSTRYIRHLTPCTYTVCLIRVVQG